MNLEEEVIADFLVTKKRKALWSVQLELLHEFQRVCNEYGLRYFADSGTLLGAVRHKGFIPWDDDIDVVMLRDDYEKLCKVAPSAFGKDYFFQNTYTDNIVRQHSQLRKNGTTMACLGDYGTKYHKGIFFDIFVLDNVPIDDTFREVLGETVKKKYMSFIPPRKKLGKNKPWFLVEAYNLLFYPLKRFCYNLKEKFRGGIIKDFNGFNRLCEAYNDVDTGYLGGVALYGSMGDKIIAFDKKWYSETVMLPFEDIEISCPIGYKDILTAMYGDYMTPVRGKTAHGNVYVDPETDYRQIDKLSRKQYYELFDHTLL